MTKLLITISFVSLFALKAHSIDSETEPLAATLSVTSKCKASTHMYWCTGPIKFDPAKFPEWKKDPIEKNFYIYVGKKEPSSFDEHTKLTEEFMDRTCQPAGYGTKNGYHMRTCSADGTEQEIKFIYDKRWDYWSLMCNAEGGAELLKQVYPLAKWVEQPKMPHMYKSETPVPEVRDLYDKFVYKTPIKGCHN